MSTVNDTSDTIDPTPYIRTYAKDFAALSGKRQSESVSSKKGQLETHYRPEGSTTDADVQAAIARSAPSAEERFRDAVDLSELERQAESIDATTAPEIRLPLEASAVTEPISLPKIIPGNASVPNEPERSVATDSRPVDFPVGPAQTLSPIIPTPAVSQDTEPTREGILARLRSRVGSRHTESGPQSNVLSQETVPQDQDSGTIQAMPHGKFVLPESSVASSGNSAASLPVFHSQEAQRARERIPEQPASSVLPPATAAPSPFHSFTSDFADRIDRQQASTFSVLAAEKDAPVRPIARARKGTNVLAILLGLFLIFASVGGAYAAYEYMNSNAPVASLPTAVPTLIAADSKIALTGSGIQLQESLADAANQPLPTDSVAVTYTTAPGSVPGTNVPQSGGVLFDALKLPAPDILLRNIDPSSTVGIVHAGTETRPFFILRVTSYERTFAGMLSWEPTLPSDMAIFYPLYPPVQQIVSTTSASSTAPSESSQAVSAGSFVDEVVANHDTRALKDTAGNTLMIYGYADQMTLIIARDEAAFTLILGRLQNGSK